MKITYENKNGALIIMLSGELDHHTAKKTREAIDDILSQNVSKQLVIDMSGVGFMDSSGVGLVLGRFKIMAQRGGRVEVITGSSDIRRIFEMSGIARLIRLK